MGTRGRGAPRWLRAAVVAVTLTGALLAPGHALAEEPAPTPEGAVATETVATETAVPETAEPMTAEPMTTVAPEASTAPEGMTVDEPAGPPVPGGTDVPDPGTSFAPVAAGAIAEAGNSTAVDERYAALGGPAGVLGPVLYPVDCALPGDGCIGYYSNGVVVWSAATGARVIGDAEIYEAWVDAGAVFSADAPGYPATDTFCGLRDDGCGQHFRAASIYVSNTVYATVVPDRIRAGWGAAGWEHVLGFPIDDVLCGLRDGGCLQYFETGTVYWSPATGSVGLRTGAVLGRWAQQGWEWGALGYPTSGEFCGLRGGGCGQHFQNGSIYWSPATGARVMTGWANRRWAAQGWEWGALGYPTSDQFCGLRSMGCGQHFQGGSVYQYMNGDFVDFTVAGAFRDKWAALGWEHGYLGFPTSDVFCGLRSGGCGQHFTGGSIYSSPHGIFGVPRAVFLSWGDLGWENGIVGYPTSDVFCGLRDGGCGQHFAGGSMYRNTTVVGLRGYRPNFIPTHFLGAWAAQGWENGRLGYPLNSAHDQLGYWVQSFYGGYITTITGRVVVHAR